MSHQVIIDYDDDLLINVGLSPDEFALEARLLLAAQLYEQGKLSSGQAAKWCGKGRADFLFSLERLGLPLSNLRPDDCDLEIDFALCGRALADTNTPLSTEARKTRSIPCRH